MIAHVTSETSEMDYWRQAAGKSKDFANSTDNAPRTIYCGRIKARSFGGMVTCNGYLKTDPTNKPCNGRHLNVKEKEGID